LIPPVGQKLTCGSGEATLALSALGAGEVFGGIEQPPSQPARLQRRQDAKHPEIAERCILAGDSDTADQTFTVTRGQDRHRRIGQHRLQLAAGDAFIVKDIRLVVPPLARRIAAIGGLQQFLEQRGVGGCRRQNSGHAQSFWIRRSNVPSGPIR
jgi:hypothetical protein